MTWNETEFGDLPVISQIHNHLHKSFVGFSPVATVAAAGLIDGVGGCEDDGISGGFDDRKSGGGSEVGERRS